MGPRGRSLPKTPSKTLAYGSFGRTKRRCVDTHPAEVAAISSEPSTSTHARARTRSGCSACTHAERRPYRRQGHRMRSPVHSSTCSSSSVKKSMTTGTPGDLCQPYRGQTDHAWPSCLARSLVQAARAAHPSKMGRDDATDAGGLLGRPDPSTHITPTHSLGFILQCMLAHTSLSPPAFAAHARTHARHHAQFCSSSERVLHAHLQPSAYMVGPSRSLPRNPSPSILRGVQAGFALRRCCTSRSARNGRRGYSRRLRSGGTYVLCGSCDR